MAWLDVSPSCPSGFHNPDSYFLVRPKGLRPGTGRPFTPTVVARDGSELFRPDNHIDPIKWPKGTKIEDYAKGPTTDMYEAQLEWHPLPED